MARRSAPTCACSSTVRAKRSSAKATGAATPSTSWWTANSTSLWRTLGRTLVDVKDAAKTVLADDVLSDEMISQLGDAARFMVYGKNHVMHREDDAIDRITFLKTGWVRRSRGMELSAGISDLAMGADE